MPITERIPVGTLAEAIVEFVHTTEPAPIAHHSLRTFLFAELIAQATGLDQDPEYDRDVLFAATAMHDLGLGEGVPGRERFEVEGADRAAELLRAHGVAEPTVDRVWEAIALHSSAGIAERRGVIASLTRAGVAADLGRHPDIVGDHEAAIHAALPRGGAVTAIVDAVVAHAARSAAAGAPYTLAGELTRERTQGLTRLELSTVGVPWTQ